MEPAREHTTRLDIQGLRAVAVLLVISSHLTGWPRGGFLGVDVFFVISGFLITGLLTRSAANRRSLRAYVGEFYAKRIRRILPASLLVLAVIVGLATLLLPGRAPGIRTDALWALGFAANVRFAQQGTQYFADQEPPSPVQHYWSLSVEEQYYLVWPVLLLGLVAVLDVAGRRWLLPACAAAITAALFLLALHQTRETPTEAYFSTVNRAWELGVGSTLALLCYAQPRFVEGLPSPLRSALAMLGLSAIATSAVIIGPGSALPAPGAALPVVGVAAVLLSGVAGPVRGTTLLTNRVATYLGDISYSLYLWHWVVVVFANAMLANERASVRIAVSLLATLSLSVLSYHLVEQPARRRPIAEPFTKTQARRLIIAMPALFAIAIVLPRVARTLYPPTVRPGDSIVIGAPMHVGSDQIAPTTDHARRIDEALAATRFPTLDPALDELGIDGATRDIWGGCLVGTDGCVFGRPPGTGAHTAVVVGDSVAASWAVSIGAGLEPSGWTTHAFVVGKCPAAFVKTSGYCARFHRELAARIARLHPELLVLSSSSASLLQLASGARGDAAVAEYRDGLVDAIHDLTPSMTTTGSIVILSPPPESKALSMCATAGASPSRCAGRISPLWLTHAAADREAAAKAHVRYLDARYLFCNGADWCPAFVGMTPVRYDGTHMTKAYATKIAAQVADALMK